MSGPHARNYDDPAAPRACQNCGTPLRGPYCSKCGQHDIEYHRSFYNLAHEVLEDLFHFDGKFLTSVASLLGRPGRLTVEFNAGRRASQMPPLRFYIAVTVLFFVGVHLLNHGHLFRFDREASDAATREFVEHPPPDDFSDAQQMDYGKLIGRSIEHSERIDDALRERLIAQVRAETPASPQPQKKKKTPLVELQSKDGGRLTVNGDERSAISRSAGEKFKQGKVKASDFLDLFEARIPTMLFLGMPVFALLLKLFYGRSRRYYIEHLIFSIHLHTWAFVVLMVGAGYLSLAELAGRWLSLTVNGLILIWAVWYVFTAFRTVYGQSRLATGLKMIGLGALYSLTIIFLTVVLVAFTVLWLVYF